MSQPDDEICVWIGAAGFSSSAAPFIRESVEPLAKRLRGSGKHCEIFIANDAVSLLKAPPLLGRGIAGVVGTGSVVLGAHPSCSAGVIKRGGYEWLVSDEGSGVWMTLESIRMLVHDVQNQGYQGYRSSLLDRLCDYFEARSEFLDEVPSSHQAMARIEMLARVVAEGRPDAKRRIAGFVYPNLFDLATMREGQTHDRIAAQVISASVKVMVKQVREVSEVLAAFTADQPNARERLPLVMAGTIAANPIYAQQFITAVSECTYIESASTVGDAARLYASLAYMYLNAIGREQRAIARSFDPLHTVVKLM